MSSAAAEQQRGEEVVPVRAGARRGSAPCSTSTPRRATLTRMRAQNFHPGAVPGDDRRAVTHGRTAYVRRRDVAGPRRASGATRPRRVTHGRVRITTDDGVGARGRGDRIAARDSCSCTGSAARRRTSPTTSPVLARDHTVVMFDHRGHGESDKPERSRRRTRFDRLVADTLAVADAVGLDRFRLLGHSMGGMVARRIVLGTSGPGRGAGPDGHRARPDPGLRRRPHGDRRRMVALDAGQGRAEGAARLGRAARTRPRTSACSRSGPATRSSRTGSGTRCRR